MKAALLAATALFAVGCTCTKPQQTAQQPPSPEYQQTAYRQPAYEQQTYQDRFVGERGPEGPAGARGAQGEVGQTGPAGYAVAGQRGETGPAGPAGAQGPTGARGPAGELARGPAGEVGPAGAPGAPGQRGQTGVRGASGDGYAGPAGPAGPTGPVGPAGATGERGQTLVGPAGPAGRAGPAGERGQVGPAGAAGSTTPGVAGPVGAVGTAGPRGAVGPIGPMGPTGLIENWASYRDFWFDQNMTQLHDADRYLLSEIATYMRSNPTLELGIDASTNPRATAQRDLTIRDGRINAIRNGLIAAGVPANRISAGQFGNVDQRRDGRVEVLLRTDRQVYSQSDSASRDAARVSNAQAPIGMVADWTYLQSFWFDSDESSIHPADRSRVAEIAAFMRLNPLIQIGIDSSLSPSDPMHHYDREIAARRGNAVRDAILAAGVPASRIQIGEFNDPNSRRNGRVTVLIRTDRLAQAP